MRPVDWVPAALLVAMALACLTVLRELALTRTGAACLAGLLGLALWQSVSAAWSPDPPAARDEGLLTLAYALAFALGALGLRGRSGRLVASAAVVGLAGALALGTATRLVTSEDPVGLFYLGGRLGSPIDYPNGLAAAFLIGLWPAVALAAERTLPTLGRAAALAAGAAMISGWVMTQSRGASIALGLSALAVFAVSTSRLRLLLPAATAVLPPLLSYRALTEPFRAEDELAADAIRAAGERTLWIAAAVLAAGLSYGLLDRRLDVGVRVRRAGGALVAAGAIVAVLVGAVAVAERVDDPVGSLRDQLTAWKQPPERVGSSYLLTVGSNRYDVWRVAVEQGREHPVAGIGARGFVSAYLVEGDTGDTPHRAHSVWLDAWAETGLIGLALLAVALVPAVVAAARRARREVLAAGTFGTVAYWIVHATGDWVWTVPAVTLPFALLLGSAASGASWRRVPRRAAPLAGAAVLLLAALTLLPPWLAARMSARAAGETPGAAETRLRWAERLDPLSVEPLVVRGRLASAAEAPAFFERAVERQPRSSSLHYLAGRAYLRAGRIDPALAHLETAERLAPNDRPIQHALAEARSRDAARR